LDGLHEVWRDAVEEPRQGNTIHATPSRDVEGDGIREHMIRERIATEHEDVAMPLVVVGDRRSRAMGTSALMFWTAAT
jgi:hypothetical protein